MTDFGKIRRTLEAIASRVFFALRAPEQEDAAMDALPLFACGEFRFSANDNRAGDGVLI